MTSETGSGPPPIPEAFGLDPEWTGHEDDVFTMPQAAEPSKSTARQALEWGAVIVGALVAALVIKTFLFQAFYIPSESMTDTLMVGDRVLVNKLAYDLGEVERGDIVVFHKPENAGPSDVSDFIKRVIALPGETITSVDGRVYINGQLLEEPYLDETVITTGLREQVVPEGHLFVMGDNRTNSSDSRVFGPISQDLVVGEAFIRVWPPSQFGGI